jgi:hypothetical protein
VHVALALRECACYHRGSAPELLAAACFRGLRVAMQAVCDRNMPATPLYSMVPLADMAWGGAGVWTRGVGRMVPALQHVQGAVGAYNSKRSGR